MDKQHIVLLPHSHKFVHSWPALRRKPKINQNFLADFSKNHITQIQGEDWLTLVVKEGDWLTLVVKGGDWLTLVVKEGDWLTLVVKEGDGLTLVVKGGDWLM